MPKPSQGKLLYHITHIDNMQSILELGLLSRSELEKKGIVDFIDIADPEILSKRSNYKEVLSKYVLFHFYAKNPFDGAVCKKYGSENMVIITIDRELHKENDFFIIPSHPLDSDTPDIYPYHEGFCKIRWDILDREVGRDYRDSEIKKACMAECVMEYTIPPNIFRYIFVNNEKAKDRINSMEMSKSVTVKVASNMFP